MNGILTRVKKSMKSYKTCSVSVADRNTLARIALVLLARGGWTRQSVNELFQRSELWRASHDAVEVVAYHGKHR